MPDYPVITKSIPAPIKCSVKSYGKRIDLTATIRKLKEGESFVVDGESARCQALDIGIRVGVSVTTKKEDDNGHFRVWRKMTQ